MKYQSGYVLFCESATDDLALQNAKDYCKENNLTSETVKIVRSGTYDITSVVVR